MAALARTSEHSSRRRPRRSTWFERIMALLALANLTLVLFDLSYVRFRDIYLKVVPEFTWWYGMTFKGMEPERSTVAYLETVEQLTAQVTQTGLQSPDAAALLAELRQQSTQMIDENPFVLADKSGTLELIKDKMRNRTGLDSSKQAFNLFWSRPYYTQNSFNEELNFFVDEIQPLMETNYFRRIGFDGGPRDWFWKIDSWFVLIFGLELLARSFYLSRRYKNFTLIDAILTRWYDLLLVIPFSALRLPWVAMLRIIPVERRLDDAQLVNMQPIRHRISQFLISQVAVELTEVVVLRMLDQVQNLIRDGEVSRMLLATGPERRYIDINGIDEVQVLSQRLTTLLVDQVLPQVKPEVDGLLNHSVEQAIQQAPGYQQLQQLPGVSALSSQISQQVVAQVSTNLYDLIKSVLADEKGAALMQAIVTKVIDTTRSEAQKDDTVQEVESLTFALLEEIKINYVQRVAAEDWEVLEEQRFRLYDATQNHK